MIDMPVTNHHVWGHAYGHDSHSIFGNSIFTDLRVKSETFYTKNISIVKFFQSFGNQKFWRFNLGHKVVCGQLFCTKHLAVHHCACESFFYILQSGGVSCHQRTWRIWIVIVVLLQYSQKWKFVLHELCISTCVC